MTAAAAGARLTLGARQCTLHTGAAADAVWAVGPQTLARRLFRHAPPPLARELESAIDRVEDALMAAGAAGPHGPMVLVADPMLHTLVNRTDGADAADAANSAVTLTRDQFEALFQRLE